MNIQPIRTETDYGRALERIEKLWGAKRGSRNGDLLDVLLVLVEDYESKHHAIDPPDPVEAIKFRMEQMSLSRKDLEPLIGTRGRVTEVINRRRPLSLMMIRNLHAGLRIPLESLIRVSTRGPTKPKAAAKSRSRAPRRSDGPTSR